MDGDDGGIGDWIEVVNRNGITDTEETDSCNADTDGDEIWDDTEKAIVGNTNPDGGGPLSGTDPGVFLADSTPTVRSDTAVANEIRSRGSAVVGLRGRQLFVDRVMERFKSICPSPFPRVSIHTAWSISSAELTL